MTCHISRWMLAAAVVTVLAPPSPPAVAQGREGRGGQPARPAGPAPRLPNGTPDLSGVLMGGGGVAVRNLKPGDTMDAPPGGEEAAGFTDGGGRPGASACRPECRA